LETRIKEGQGVTFCGGLLAEAIGADGGKTESRREGNSSTPLKIICDSLGGGNTVPWSQGEDLRVVANRIVPGIDTSQARVPIDFFCRCTTSKFLKTLVGTCSNELLQQMLLEEKDGVAATLLCSFCNRSHEIRSQTLLTAMEEKKSV